MDHTSQQQSKMPEENKHEDGDIELKIFPKPTKTEIDSYTDKKKRLWIAAGFLVAVIIWGIIFLLALLAFIEASKEGFYKNSNLGIMIVLFTVVMFFTHRFISSLNPGYEAKKAIVSDVINITSTYESIIPPEERGKKIKMELSYEFSDENESIKKFHFVILFEREKLNEIKPDIPDVGSEIYIIYNKKKGVPAKVFLPHLKEYLM